MWAYLIHLGDRFWHDNTANKPHLPRFSGSNYGRPKEEALLCEKDVWRRITGEMQGVIDTLVIDLGEGVIYESHPELAVTGSWTKQELKEELDRLRGMGITPIPKMNFSTTHDAWLGEYGRMVSTSAYYKVCADLICEACELFDYPKLFHIGMDEEKYRIEEGEQYIVLRSGDLWYHDLHFYQKEVEKHGARAWMWADLVALNTKEYIDKTSRDILQSQWYYHKGFFVNPDAPPASDWADAYKFYEVLDKAGFEQVPCCSNWACVENTELLMRYCKEKISEKNLLGFMSAPWQATCRPVLYSHLEAIDLMKLSKKMIFDQ